MTKKNIYIYSTKPGSGRWVEKYFNEIFKQENFFKKIDFCKSITDLRSIFFQKYDLFIISAKHVLAGDLALAELLYKIKETDILIVGMDANSLQESKKLLLNSNSLVIKTLDLSRSSTEIIKIFKRYFK